LEGTGNFSKFSKFPTNFGRERLLGGLRKDSLGQRDSSIKGDPQQHQDLAQNVITQGRQRRLEHWEKADD
jgi:hypothetical protein